MQRSRISCHQMFGTTQRRSVTDGSAGDGSSWPPNKESQYEQYRREQLDSESRRSRETKGATHVDDPHAPDNHLDAWTVHRRAYRLRAWPLEDLWQQRRRVPQGP